MVTLGGGITEQDLIVHDETNPALAYLLSRMGPPAFPTPIGVLAAVARPCYEDVLVGQVVAAKAKGTADLRGLLNHGETWVVQ